MYMIDNYNISVHSWLSSYKLVFEPRRRAYAKHANEMHNVIMLHML